MCGFVTGAFNRVVVCRVIPCSVNRTRARLHNIDRWRTKRRDSQYFRSNSLLGYALLLVRPLESKLFDPSLFFLWQICIGVQMVSVDATKREICYKAPGGSSSMNQTFLNTKLKPSTVRVFDDFVDHTAGFSARAFILTQFLLSPPVSILHYFPRIHSHKCTSQHDLLIFFSSSIFQAFLFLEFSFCYHEAHASNHNTIQVTRGGEWKLSIFYVLLTKNEVSFNILNLRNCMYSSLKIIGLKLSKHASSLFPTLLNHRKRLKKR